MENESNSITEILDERTDVDVVIEHEVAMMLVGKPALASIIFQFHALARIKDLHYLTQKELAAKMGFSEPNFKEKRDLLVEMGLLVITRKNKKISYKLRSLKPKVDEDFKLTQQTAKNKKDSVEKFPQADYEVVLDAYCKAKRIELAGPEIARIKHAIKQMFLAKRTPEQIVACIHFFKRYQSDERYKWMQHWTMETIMKKIPEFVGGTLKVQEMGDDLPNV